MSIGNALLEQQEQRSGQEHVEAELQQLNQQEEVTETAPTTMSSDQEQQERKEMLLNACDLANIPRDTLDKYVEKESEDFEEMFYTPMITAHQAVSGKLVGYEGAVNEAQEKAPELAAKMKRFGELNSEILVNQGLDVYRVSEIEDNLSKNKYKNEDDWAQLRRKFGAIVHDEVKRTYDEMQEHNPSGGYIVSKAWNNENRREMTAAEVIQLLTKHIKKQDEKIVKLQNENSRLKKKK